MFYPNIIIFKITGTLYLDKIRAPIDPYLIPIAPAKVSYGAPRLNVLFMWVLRNVRPYE